MDGFPFALILAVATASATLFLGFLPTAGIRPGFFARETFRAILAWCLVTLLTPPPVMHFPFLFALLCIGAWRQFSHDSAFSGKMLLWVVSGLGIGLGVMLILTVTPRAWPPGLSEVSHVLLLASIYLGGAIIGLACVSASLAHNLSTDSGVTYAIVQRYVGLLFKLTLARAIVLPALLVLTPNLPGHAEVVFTYSGYVIKGSVSSVALLLLGLVIVVIPVMAYLAWRATRFSSKIKPTRYLLAICILSFLAETLARLLVL